MRKKFEPLQGRNADIIESVMNCDEVASLGEDLKFKIRLCVEEIEENILCYSGSTWVEVTADLKDGELTIGFSDGGIEFDPLSQEDPDINGSVEARSIGGLGIFICKNMMDSLDYHFEKGCNILKMKKKIN